MVAVEGAIYAIRTRHYRNYLVFELSRLCADRGQATVYRDEDMAPRSLSRLES
jgi:hypothetical protein